MMQLGLCSVLRVHYVVCCVPSGSWKTVSNIQFLHVPCGTRMCQMPRVLLVWYSWSTRELSEIPFLGVGVRAGKELCYILRILKMCISFFIHVCVFTELFDTLAFTAPVLLRSIIYHFPEGFSDFLLSMIQANLAGECHFYFNFFQNLLYMYLHT